MWIRFLASFLSWRESVLFSLISFTIHVFVFNELWDYILKGKDIVGYSKNELIWYIIIVVLIVPLFGELEGFSSLPIFKYLDEFIAIISAMYIIKKWKKLSKNEKNIVRLILCLLIVGSLSTFIYQLQTGVFPVALDA